MHRSRLINATPLQSRQLIDKATIYNEIIELRMCAADDVACRPNAAGSIDKLSAMAGDGSDGSDGDDG